MYQSILPEGKTEGRAEGRVEGERELLMRLLNRKIGTIPAQIPAKIAGLSSNRLEALGEALLDFQTIADLEDWLRQV